ncbi:glycoside hydrolase family 15 [Ornithinimicrobium sp. F0845]|uniref:glycoside hydrolase family 15 n=1 Tax=Ornithinimicrobium sp. F0845 TaxID=2926412 RepID=UPI001FF28F3E|nr:glycoside hydrolase family 15 [Ornithinimicrobium sp. F0845]MCK0111829.1 glycoside hydrolase family 15 [Ornithinimicrobium sp. F0845]
MTSAAVTLRVAVVAVLGWFVALTALPPRGGPVRGLGRSFDPHVDHLLWPWTWGQADPRLLLIAPMVLAGALLCRRVGWLVAVAVLPVLVEVWQYAVPQVAQAASARDVVHAWIGLGVGALLGRLVLLAARLLARSSRPVRVVTPVLTVCVLAMLAVVTLRPAAEPEEIAAAGVPAPQGELLGEGFHESDVPAPAVRAWMTEGTLPGEGTAYEEMARVALWDLALLTRGLDKGLLPVAGPAAKWDYFWPRDGAFVAVALARSGHADDAVRLLELVSGLYLDPLYGFDARYLSDGGRVVEDARGAQVDGCGWVLWAVHETGLVTNLPPRVSDLRDRCTDQLLRATGGGSRLAAASPDYWERATFDRLLGANAPLASGLRSAAADYEAAGLPDRAAVVGAAAESFRGVLGESFGPDFERGGDGGGLDAATTMLLPPFDPEPLPGAREAWLGYQEGALRPAGGLAPGTAWKQDGVSWTPEVALVAYTAAADGQDAIARHWLDWLDAHRAPSGSLPEKVGPDGMAGGPSPLGWTSALVLLTLAEL